MRRRLSDWVEIVALIALFSVWLCLALGVPSFVRGLRKDESWDIPPWWALLAAVGAIVLIDLYYKEHSKTAKAQHVLRALADHVENNNYRQAVSGLQDAATDRADWDTRY